MSTSNLPPASSIPVATLGARPEVASAIRTLLEPEYDLVHICTNPQTATAELPPLCAGNLSNPETSGLGSNSSRPVSERRVPRAIIFGGAVDDVTLEGVMGAVREAVAAAGEKKEAEGEEGKKEVPVVVRVTRADILAQGVDVPNPEVITKVIMGKCEELKGKGLL
ncbi:hypothetical protein VTJ49DRAFT_1558 [Mycothermus thermophilus]|uniref:Uncharacterized protein n=1 Tax=Humicola insolens TaxID=85995 RepID=A0ABR3VP55_HUMIN